MAETLYLTLDEIIALHDEILERMGSSHAPLIHRDTLESALNRPRTAAWYEEADLIRQAVLLAIGISQSQAFLDGNKRAAFAATRVFLQMNCLLYRGDSLEIARWLKLVAEEPSGPGRDAVSDHFEAWLRTQVIPDDSFRP